MARRGCLRRLPRVPVPPGPYVKDGPYCIVSESNLSTDGYDVVVDNCFDAETADFLLRCLNERRAQQKVIE